jgi:hypothetical protein
MERRIKVRDINGHGQLLRSQLDQRQRSRIMPTEKERIASVHCAQSLTKRAQYNGARPVKRSIS